MSAGRVSSRNGDWPARHRGSVSPGNLIFQAKDSASQEWFVSTFGNGIDLDIDDHQVLDLELMRRGLRKRGIFGPVGGSVAGLGAK